MKYKSEKTLRRAKKAFSLIELMIVIVIIGALTAIILPQFDVSEAEAKDAGCDASNYGTLSQLTKFRSLNGAYPAGLHAGYEVASGGTASTNTLMGTTGTAEIPSFTKINMTAGDGTGTGQSTNILLNNQTAYGTSLKEAGVVNLAYGGFGGDVAFIGMSASADKYISVIKYNWYEAWADDGSGDGVANDGIIQSGEMEKVDTASTPISINGIPLPYYSFSDPYEAYSDSNTNISSIVTSVTNVLSTTDQDGIVVPLFLAPTVDWEHWYDADGNQNDSKIQVAQVGQCPWLEAEAEFRYYIAIFKLYADGSKAELLGTMCPEGGSLNP